MRRSIFDGKVPDTHRKSEYLRVEWLYRCRQKSETGLSYFMAERIFESAFHKKYVGGEGEVLEKTVSMPDTKHDSVSRSRTTEAEVLEEYRRYVRDPNAELPEEIKKTFLAIQRTENDRE